LSFRPRGIHIDLARTSRRGAIIAAGPAIAVALVKSTMTVDTDKAGIFFAYDEATKTWSRVTL
jgi:hypothetical protein